jgi:sialate O-acetylesterase
MFPKCLSAVVLMVTFAMAAAPALEIQGAVPNQVVQCDDDGLATFHLSGSTSHAGRVEVRYQVGAEAPADWRAAGESDGKAWKAALDAVPAGGPYKVEVRIVNGEGAALDSGSVGDLYAGDLWILAGQSNMQGVGNMADVETPIGAVKALRMDRQWATAEEPLHVLQESPDAVHYQPKDEAERAASIAAARGGSKGAGLGLTFAKEMYRLTGRPVGLICTAHGGTSMAQWDPALRDKGGDSLYGSMLLSLQAAGGKVRGVVWYQGESDANGEASVIYEDKFAQFIEAVRADCGDPELPFYAVQIGRFSNAGVDGRSWNRVQNAELNLETRLKHYGLAPAIDLALDDLIHIGTPGLKTLGLRVANMAHHDLYGGPVSRGPRLASMERVTTPFGHALRVTFDHVNGGLQSAGRMSGFTLSEGAEGPDTARIYKQEVAPDSPNTLVLWVQEWPAEPYLWYGRGADPYCNVVDGAGMAMPVFGPVAVP